jgi:hypothetical protein
MRALILVLAALVVGLAVPVLLHAGGGAREGKPGEMLRLGLLIANARPGEEAIYKDQDGNTLIWSVVARQPAAVSSQERIVVRRRLIDSLGRPMDPRWADLSYEHDSARHGWFPVMAPQDAQGLDRLWVWARMRRDVRVIRGKERPCWRIDAIDPGLPEGSDEVYCWFDEDAPVYGLVEWHRAGRTWTLVGAKTAGGRG